MFDKITSKSSFINRYSLFGILGYKMGRIKVIIASPIFYFYKGKPAAPLRLIFVKRNTVSLACSAWVRFDPMINITGFNVKQHRFYAEVPDITVSPNSSAIEHLK